MNNFVFNKYTKLHFGQDTLETLPADIKAVTAKPILLTYGGGSIKASGLYDQVIGLLNDASIEFIELSGIKPNPEVDTARTGIELIKQNGIELILAIGGGSVLDNSKHMAAGSASEQDIWEIISNPSEAVIDDAKIPKIGSIITLAATGSEMNNGGVMSNPEAQMKLGFGHPKLAPTFTYEDPTQLYTLPEYQRRAGLCDILSHLLECYFSSHTDDLINDRLVEAVIKNTIACGDQYIAGNDYTNAANIFWSSTMALNGIINLGRAGGDWRAHGLEHEISAFTDLTHGIGLAIVQPKLLEYYFNKDVAEGNSLVKFENLGVNVFELSRDDQDLAAKTVAELKAVFARFGNVVTLDDVDIADLDNELIANRVAAASGSSYYKLTEAETLEVVESFYQA